MIFLVKRQCLSPTSLGMLPKRMHDICIKMGVYDCHMMISEVFTEYTIALDNISNMWNIICFWPDKLFIGTTDMLILDV